MHRALWLAPLAYAIEHRRYDAIELLLSRGAKTSSSYLWHKSLDARALELLLRYGCNINDRYERRTALIHMINSNSAEAVRLLLEYGADPSEPDGHGIHPIKWALSNQKDKIKNIEALCQYGADLTVGYGNAPLVQGIFWGNPLVYKCLIPLLKWGMPCTWDDIPKDVRGEYTEDELKTIDGYIRANNR